MSASKRVLLLKAGETEPAIRLGAGDYDRWFASALRHSSCRFHIVRVASGQKLPSSAKSYDLVVMTGSPLSATEPTGWMKASATFLRESGEQGVPVLGVCFGHQLLGYAYGSRVVVNPKGREIGSVPVTLSALGQRDPLFRGLPKTSWVQTTHRDVVETLPPGAELLASNTNSRIQAMAIGRHIRGVQFHPELSPEAMRTVILCRKTALESEAQATGWPPGERVRSLLAGIRPSRLGETILSNFLQCFE